MGEVVLTKDGFHFFGLALFDQGIKDDNMLALQKYEQASSNGE